MNYDSVLNGSAMAGQCREMASRLKQEIDFYSFEISAINTFIESKTSGEAATALKNKAEKLIQMLQIAISANEYDIRDCNILAEMVDGITIDGYEVLTRKQEARNNAEECYNQAAYYSRVASECIISSIGNHFYELANTYRGYAVSWERIEDALHKIENQYDDIDYDSSILFKDGYDTRCLLDNEEYDVVLLDCPMPTGVTKGGNTIVKDSEAENLNRDELSDEELMTKYWFLYEHLKKLMNPGADDEEIFDAMRNINDKMPLVNFWATYHFSQNDYHKLVDILDRDYFVKEQIDVLNMYLEINNLIWTEDEKQKVLEEYYKKYAPKDDYDYSMFAAGVELVVGKDIFIVEWDKCEKIYGGFYLENKKTNIGVFEAYIYPTCNGDGRKVCLPEDYNCNKWYSLEYQTKVNEYVPEISKANNVFVDENGTLLDSSGRYWIAVGPLVTNPDFSMDKRVDWTEARYGTLIDVVIQDNSGNKYYLPCVNGCCKEHTYPTGIIQTGKLIPSGELTNPENADGSVIEFMGMSAEGLSEYSIVEIIVYDGEISTAGGN